MGSMLLGRRQTDEDLMLRVQAGDHAAFAELYDRHAARAYRVAQAVCQDARRAEEAVQEGFLAVWRGRARYRPETGSFKAWSMRIVQNRAIDSFRVASRPQEQWSPLDDEIPDGYSKSPPDEVIARSEGVALRSSLRWLPEAQSEVIALAYYGGLSHSEIATHLNLPPGTVKGRMRLGLEKVRSRMAEPARTH